MMACGTSSSNRYLQPTGRTEVIQIEVPTEDRPDSGTAFDDDEVDSTIGAKPTFSVTVIEVEPHLA